MSENPHNSSRNKLLAIEYYNENNVIQAEVSKIFKISKQILYTYIGKYYAILTLNFILVLIGKHTFLYFFSVHILFK